jgi:hypothetical protein
MIGPASLRVSLNSARQDMEIAFTEKCGGKIVHGREQRSKADLAPCEPETAAQTAGNGNAYFMDG